MKISLSCLLLLLATLITQFSILIGLEKKIPNTTKGNYMKMLIHTSDCFRSGTNGRFDFWLFDGIIMNGKIHFNKEAELLGPFSIDGDKGKNLERHTENELHLDHAGGHYRTIKDNMQLLIIKKHHNGYLNRVSDGWKPEFIKTSWSDRHGRELSRNFVFPADCKRGWLKPNDYYVANDLGHMYRLGKTDHLSIEDVVNHRIPGDIEVL
uniref:S-protein homolog n=1 Tax=Steinernema glaseri TaxID=37863 RepID=A0A1I7ZP84_9BILA